MSALPIVEDLDVLEEGSACFVVTVEGIAPKVHLCLECPEEALHRSVVVTLAASAHRDRDPARAKQLLIPVARVLTPLVRMVNQAGAGSP